jgi:hypothetical protein
VLPGTGLVCKELSTQSEWIATFLEVLDKARNTYMRGNLKWNNEEK